MNLCLVSPYALHGEHPVADQVRGLATALSARGHRVTVLAPSPSSRALRSGRHRLRALAGGDTEALRAASGEPLVVAVGPALPVRRGGRRGGAGIPVAAGANVALAVGEGGFDVVHVFEPTAPGIALAALKHARRLTAATFGATSERALSVPMRSSSRERYRARIDALIATSEEAATMASASYPGDYELVAAGIGDEFTPAAKRGDTIAAEWTVENRQTIRELVRLVSQDPGRRLDLIWPRRGRRPLRPYVPATARGRVRMLSPRPGEERAAALAAADVFVAAPGGDPLLPWQARAAGCAVVATHAGDDAAGPGLVYAADQPALAAAATARLFDDPALREQLAREAVEPVGHRRFPALAEQLERIYESMQGRKRPRRPRALEGQPLIDVDLHMHTDHSYDCATDVAALLDHCIAEGFGAIAITDHNEVSGALAARELGKPITVIVGEEVMTSQGEVIGLFLNERIEPGMTMAETVAAIHEQDGLVSMPHPFDRLHTIPDAATLLGILDAIDVFEIYNSRLLFESFNDDAQRFAEKYNLLAAAGSDAHVLPGIGTAINRMPAFDGPEEFLLSLRQNEIIRRPRSLLYLQGLKWVQNARS